MFWSNQTKKLVHYRRIRNLKVTHIHKTFVDSTNLY
jgi:hypothetical protein